MGKRGPAPRPTSLKLLQGDRSDRVNVDEPTPSSLPIDAPDYLDDDARAVWDRLAPDLERQGVLTAWDVDALAVFCTAVVHHRRAVQTVNQTQVLLKASGGHTGIVKHPAMQIIRDQAAVIRAFGQEFGLTPSARSELTSPHRERTSRADRLLS